MDGQGLTSPPERSAEARGPWKFALVCRVAAKTSRRGTILSNMRSTIKTTLWPGSVARFCMHRLLSWLRPAAKLPIQASYDIYSKPLNHTRAPSSWQCLTTFTIQHDASKNAFGNIFKACNVILQTKLADRFSNIMIAYVRVSAWKCARHTQLLLIILAILEGPFSLRSRNEYLLINLRVL